MLKEKAEFNEAQIRRLVYFMGARAAFNVIYFHTPEERGGCEKKHSEQSEVRKVCQTQK